MMEDVVVTIHNEKSTPERDTQGETDHTGGVRGTLSVFWNAKMLLFLLFSISLGLRPIARNIRFDVSSLLLPAAMSSGLSSHRAAALVSRVVTTKTRCRLRLRTRP